MKHLNVVFRGVGVVVILLLSLVEMLFEVLHAAMGACAKATTWLMDYVASIIE